MKNRNDKENRKFHKQVNHLQSFIGMPQWNGRNPTLSEIREYDRRLIEKQAEEVKPKKNGFLRFLFGGLKTQGQNTSSLISNIKKKTKSINHEITQPIKTDKECCG